MKLDHNFMEALENLERERNIPKDDIIQALAEAFLQAYKREPNAAEEAVVNIEPDTGNVWVFAQELDDEGNVIREWDDTPKYDLGRIAASTVKQILSQKIREHERNDKYKEYQGREGGLVTGIVQQGDNRYTLLDLGKVEALLPTSEQVMHERYEQGSRLKAYVVEVRKTPKGPQIVVSRTHPGLVKNLFELEVPEIADGVVEIKAMAREPGARTKIAVYSNDPNVDASGACIGARGARVRQVVNELRGEKIDIVPFSTDLVAFVREALGPAKVKDVTIDEMTGIAIVIVPDNQLSLAIGKEGQNARLAARLTGCRIDIKGETQYEEEFANGHGDDYAEGEWVIDPETGGQVWIPADGGEAISLDAYNAEVGQPDQQADTQSTHDTSEPTQGDAESSQGDCEVSQADAEVTQGDS